MLTLHLQALLHDGIMQSAGRTAFLMQALSCWNWKCALLSATARSLVYLAAVARTGFRGGLALIVVEVAYVTLTSGLYAGLQQKALGFPSRWLGNVIIAFAVPGLSQLLDWLAHRAAGETAPARATFAVCLFTAISALFHLYVMRRGVFLTGRDLSLFDDFRRVPRLIADSVVRHAAIISSLALRLARSTGSQSAL